MAVIIPLDKDRLLSFFDEKALETIKYFMIRSLFSQPELLPNQKPIPLQFPKEHIEQWFAQALGVVNIGGGSYPIDIYSPEQSWGADIKMLSVDRNPDDSIHPGDSGEASLGQNFKGAGKQLDVLFENQHYDTIKTLWLELYKDKFESVPNRYPVKDFYYFFLIRCGNSFYLMAAEIDLENLDQVEADLQRSNPLSSVWLNNMIDIRYGNTKVYKAKKRLELRLRPKAWVEDNKSIEFKTNFQNIESELREELSDENFKEKAFERLRELEIEVII